MAKTRQQWFDDAKYGLFIHWGLYSILAGEYKGRKTDRIAEWIENNFDIPVEEYEKLAEQFNPTQFNADALGSAGVELSGYSYPVIVRKGTNDLGKTIRYFLNYSGSEQAVTYKYGDAEDVITGKEIKAGTELKIPAWNVRIIEA